MLGLLCGLLLPPRGRLRNVLNAPVLSCLEQADGGEEMGCATCHVHHVASRKEAEDPRASWEVYIWFPDRQLTNAQWHWISFL